MTRRLAGWVTALVVGSGTVGVAQKVVGPEEFDRAMKTIGAAIAGVEEALGSASYVEAKTPLALSRQVLASTRPEWEANGQSDAVRMTREAVAALDALDAALSAATVDAAAVAAIFEDVTRACDACHTTYREGDPRTGYRIRSLARGALGTGVSAQDAARTSWGDPDLQGIWVGSTLTPLERPSEYEGRAFLTRAEVTAIETEARAHAERLLKRPAERAPAGGDVNYRADGSLGYDHFWLDEGSVWEPSGRTSLIVDPPSGRIPYTPTVLDHARPYGAGPWDSHLDLDTGERCFGDGLPQIWFGDNPNHQIFQTPTDVVILHEMYHQRRIIPIDGRPQTGITQWNGEPRGRWEGSTLVVESRYFPGRPQDRPRHIWRAPGKDLHLVERFTRVDAETIEYEVTIADPTRFTRPWTVRFPLSTDQSGRGVAAGRLFEFACHEGNYAIRNVRRGARARDTPAAAR